METPESYRKFMKNTGIDPKDDQTRCVNMLEDLHRILGFRRSPEEYKVLAKTLLERFSLRDIYDSYRSMKWEKFKTPPQPADFMAKIPAREKKAKPLPDCLDCGNSGVVFVGDDIFRCNCERGNDHPMLRKI